MSRPNSLETPLGHLRIGDRVRYRTAGQVKVKTVKWLKITHMLDIIGVEPYEIHGGISYRALIEILPQRKAHRSAPATED